MNELLLQVGDLIKQKKENDVFNIKCLPNWNPKMDYELNKLIQTHQICGILPHGFDGEVCTYRASSSSNHAVYQPDIDMINRANVILQKEAQYKGMKGYSRDLKEYCDEINEIKNQLIDAQSEFIDFNHSIILSLLEGLGLELATIYGSKYYKISLGAAPTIDKLINLYSDCAKRLLMQ